MKPYIERGLTLEEAYSLSPTAKELDKDVTGDNIALANLTKRKKETAKAKKASTRLKNANDSLSSSDLTTKDVLERKLSAYGYI